MDKDFKFISTREVAKNSIISEITLRLPYTIDASAGDAITQPTATIGGYTFTGGSGTVKSSVTSKNEVILNRVVGRFISTTNGLPSGNPLLLNGAVLTNSGNAMNPSAIFTRYKTNTYPETTYPVKGVSYYDYEVKMNEDKRKIKVLKPEYLSVFISDMRSIMKYNRSSQYLNQKTKQTYNPTNIGV